LVYFPYFSFIYWDLAKFYSPLRLLPSFIPFWSFVGVFHVDKGREAANIHERRLYKSTGGSIGAKEKVQSR